MAPNFDRFRGWSWEYSARFLAVFVTTKRTSAPLRLATPNKYGIKCLKRLGVIRYARQRPADYWAERSYDWYAGL